MRRATAAAVLLPLLMCGCVTPAGTPVEECNTSWRGLAARIVTGAENDRRAIPIACIWSVDEERISIGFEMPPGPECYELAAIEQEESADAVAVTLFVAPASDVGGACPTEPRRAVTEVDLQAPVGDRVMLDGSR